MKLDVINIYKNQLSKKKYLKLITEITGVKKFKGTNSFQSFIGEDYIITVTDRFNISISSLNDECAIANKVVDGLVSKLNAEKICHSFNGHDTWYDLDKYKPKLINRIRYKLIEILKD
ncbi:hypothetical protein [Lysinibacillus sp. NPDC086135]|uniref:hypothetical protein n=1 Tax=Lysinibacillus sp. NPDC086135 TaxID=3364130 RepID=UPI00380F5E21